MNKIELQAADIRRDSKKALARLKELGVQVTHAQMLEAFAASFGHANWHVMAATLPAKEKPVKVRNEVTLFMETYFTSECDPGYLSWMGVTLSQAFIDHLLRLQKTAKATASSVTVDEWPDELSSEEYLKYSELVVTDSEFWFKVSDKYSSGHYEHSAFPVDLAVYLATSKNPKEYSHLWIELQFPEQCTTPGVVIVGDENSVLFEELMEAGHLPYPEDDSEDRQSKKFDSTQG